MPATFSKIAPPSDFSTDDDIPDGDLPGSPELWTTSLPSKNRSVPTGYHPDISPVSGSATINGAVSRYPGATGSLRPSGFTAAGSYQRPRPRPTQVPNDLRSRSIISISSDDPGAVDVELTELRKENMELKIECGQLRGQIIGLQ